MATAALIPVGEYLDTTYSPDCDYIDGELKERNVGEEAHAEIQAILARVIGVNRKKWGVRVYTEVRVQTSDAHFRVPDVCVVESSRPRGRIIRYAPLVCIEILSPEDRVTAMMEKIDDYAQLGVTHIWVVDPAKRMGYYASADGLVRAEDHVLRVSGTSIAISLGDVFAELDEF
ncbi:MAG TPA: Uma2 family endonuclease [Acidobacteriaceae bacterium]